MRAPTLVGCWLLVAGACAACTSGQMQRQEAAYAQSIDSRLLAPQSDNDAAGQVQRYTLQPRQLFRMPQPLQAPDPELPPEVGRQTLPATVVCVSVAIADHGTVMHAVPLAAREGCEGSIDPGNAGLIQAAIEAVSRWRFRPAAMCSYADDPASDDPGDCADAVKVQPVAVTLQYAFTFEVRQGQATVRSGGLPHR